ncbi:MAG: hypothetical protein MUC87_09905 [Bacteroidia bacterium]|jgi:hypothetical protein|nr:hypothetical protein [Bacteroidia bacterium]
MKLPQVFLKLLTPTLVLGALVFQTSCSGDSETASNDTLTGDSVITETDIEDEGGMLPSPLQVAAIFKSSGLKYLPGITSSAEKASSYSTTFTRAWSMGVYSADMAYCVLNKQTQPAQTYLKAVRSQAEQINLGKIFAQTSLFDRFNNNLGNEDSLQSILAGIKEETDAQLLSNDQNHLYGVIFAGAWIESLHIAGKVYEQEPNEQVMLKLFEQMVILESITKELERNKSKDESIAPLLADLNSLQDVFNGLASVKKMNENPDLGFGDVKPTKEELMMLIKKVEEIHSKTVTKA